MKADLQVSILISAFISSCVCVCMRARMLTCFLMGDCGPMCSIVCMWISETSLPVLFIVFLFLGQGDLLLQKSG